MFELFPELTRWILENQQFAIATVVRTWGSSPRAVGAKMAVNHDSEIIGSVSGGCVEGTVVSACMETIRTGKPQLLHFDVEDRTAWEVGLACGGELDVFVQVPSATFMDALSQANQTEKALTAVTFIKGNNEFIGSEIILTQEGQAIGAIDPHLDLEIHQLLQNNPSKSNCVSLTTGDEIFIDINFPPPTLIIVGGVHIAVALTRIARACNYRVIIVDPRRQFGTKLRFPEADQVLNLWPDKAFEQVKLTSNTAITFLTHDPKIDDPGLIIALPSPAFYIGGLGSKKTQASRRSRLLEAGIAEEILNRLHGPIGLNLGGRSPEEIALAIMAQIIQTRHQ